MRAPLRMGLPLRAAALSLLVATVVAVATAAAAGADRAAPAQPNQVIQWNRILLGILRTPGAQPATVHPTRSLAIVHAAIYAAVNSIDRKYQPYLVAVSALRSASPEAAVAAAAHRALADLYPAQQQALDADFTQALAQIPNGPGKAAGIRVGEAAAQAIVALRSGDGSDAHAVPFTPGKAAGDYQLTPPSFQQPVFTFWAGVRPFALRSRRQLRPAPPPALTSRAYTDAFDEVKSLGAVNSTSRTAEQTTIGKFWGGPIQTNWNQIAETAAIAHRDTLQQDARLFALLNLSLADSVIALYDAKYAYRVWRPVTAIRAADTDGNPATVADPNWTPLAPTALDPSYPGAHSTISYAGATVLASVLGDRLHFAVTSDTLPGVDRVFHSFTAAAEEAGLSRIYAGQHFRTDHLAGKQLGTEIGDYVVRDFLKPAE